VELNGRIKESFGLEGNAVKVTPDQTVSTLALAIQKALKQAEASPSAEEQAEANNDQVDTGDSVGENQSRTDISSLVDAELEEEKILVPPLGTNMKSSSSSKDAKLVIGPLDDVTAHIIRYLLKAGARRVYCVASDVINTLFIKNRMEELGLWKASFEGRVIALSGDPTKTHFDIKEQQYGELLGEVGAVVVSGGWRSAGGGDDLHSQSHISTAINAVRFARQGGASLHHMSTGWIDPFEAEEGEVEEVLQVACENYDVDCSSYRLPLVTISSKQKCDKVNGVKCNNIIFELIKACKVAGVVSKDWEKGVLPLLPADVAGKFVVRWMEVGRKGKPAGAVSVRNTISLNTYMPTTTILDYADDLGGKPLIRGVEYREAVMAFAKALRQDEGSDVGSSATKAHEVMDIMSKDAGEIATKIVANRPSLREVVDAAIHRPCHKQVVESLKRHLDQHPEVAAVHAAKGLKQQKSEETKEEEATQQQMLRAIRQ